MRTLVKGLIGLVAILIFAAIVVRVFLGGGERLDETVTTAPVFKASALEKVVDLDYPPGNIAVSSQGRVFFTLHPDGKPPVKVVELVDGKPVPYPSEEWQHETDALPYFQTILSIRIDQQDRLWVLDFAEFGQGQPRISAFDLASGKLVHTYDFPREIAGLASMLNDFQVSPDGKKIYIAETSPVVHRPALIVYDVEAKKSRRVLHRHESVLPEKYLIEASNREMRAYGLVALRIGVDSIGLDGQGEWLYYGPSPATRCIACAPATWTTSRCRQRSWPSAWKRMRPRR
jgi:hypothetical protein